MSCENPVALIFKGEDYALNLVIKTQSGKLYDLTGSTEINARFKKEGTSDLLEKKLSLSGVTIVSAIGGEIQVNLTDTDTGSMLIKDLQDFDVVIDVGSNRRIAFFSKKLSVRKALI